MKLAEEAIEKVITDNRLSPSNVSLYIALLHFWIKENCAVPMNISRREIMPLSKIMSKATYHKCIKDLNDFGLIKYTPSYNPFKGSEIEFLGLDDQGQKFRNKKEIVLRISIES